MAEFFSTHANFQRILQLTKSTSRSLSPENELRQMTCHHTYASLSRDAVNDALGGIHSFKTGNYQQHSITDVDEWDETGITSFRHRQNNSGVPMVSAETSSPSVTLANIDTESSTARGVTKEGTLEPNAVTENRKRGLPEGDTRNLWAAAPWQYGSPVFDPVSEHLYCWHRHQLKLRARQTYVDVDGVSCDFCGFTAWRNGESKRPGDAANARKQVEGSHPTEPQFFHCETCSIDVCERCGTDIKLDARYHIPCMKCQLCEKYMSREHAAVHRCRPLPPVRFAAPLKRYLKVGGDTDARSPVRSEAPYIASSLAPQQCGATAEPLRDEIEKDSSKRFKRELKRSFYSEGVERASSSHPTHSSELIAEELPVRWSGNVGSSAHSSSLEAAERGSCSTDAGTLWIKPASFSGLWEVSVAVADEEAAQKLHHMVQHLHWETNLVEMSVDRATFRLATRLAAEIGVQHANDAGLLAALRKCDVSE